MSGRPKFIERTLLRTIPLDQPNMQIRVYRKRWQDGSEGIDIQKWFQRENGHWTMYKPQQYLQIVIDHASRVVGEIDVTLDAIVEVLR